MLLVIREDLQQFEVVDDKRQLVSSSGSRCYEYISSQLARVPFRVAGDGAPSRGYHVRTAPITM